MRQPKFRATRTTPDPYPPHPVLVFTDKTEEEVRRSQMVPISDLEGRFQENAYGSELSDFIEIAPGPHFRAKLTSVGEIVLLTTPLTLAEVEGLPDTVQVVIALAEDSPSQVVNRSQLSEIEPIPAAVA